MIRRIGLSAVVALAFPGIAIAAAPKPAPAAYATPNYALTFAVPPGLTYCPLPAGRVGSDHGTTLFLTPPHSCEGSDFSPKGTPRIEIYYGWWSDDDPAPTCRRPRGRLRLLGERTVLCDVHRDGLGGVELHARYPLSGSDGEAILTLLTTPKTLAHDRAIFERLAQSLRTCTPDGAEKGFGRGAPCPKGVGWF